MFAGCTEPGPERRPGLLMVATFMGCETEQAKAARKEVRELIRMARQFAALF
jgi:hypothetical protein